jgi:hypothetical protein
MQHLHCTTLQEGDIERRPPDTLRVAIFGSTLQRAIPRAKRSVDAPWLALQTVLTVQPVQPHCRSKRRVRSRAWWEPNDWRQGGDSYHGPRILE